LQDAYPLLFALGAVAGLLWSGLVSGGQSSPKGTRITPVQALDAGLAALAAGLVGARAGYVAASWDYYSHRPQEALWFWQGGLSWSAGAAAALLGLGLYSGLSRQPFWPLADRLAIPAALLALAAWGGCMLDGCSYGWRTAPGPLTPPAPDLLGNLAPRWPTQPVGVIASLASLAGLISLGGRPLPQGTLACLSLTMIAATSVALSFTRADPTRMLWGMRLDGLASGAVLALGLAGLGHRLLQRPGRAA
jgi:phosphatidylglycerol:prolipoprotein diacylglycerol transferase